MDFVYNMDYEEDSMTAELKSLYSRIFEGYRDRILLEGEEKRLMEKYLAVLNCGALNAQRGHRVDPMTIGKTTEDQLMAVRNKLDEMNKEIKNLEKRADELET